MMRDVVYLFDLFLGLFRLLGLWRLGRFALSAEESRQDVALGGLGLLRNGLVNGLKIQVSWELGDRTIRKRDRPLSPR